MADIKYYDVIKKPVITEKSMNAMAEKKYTFLVHPEANKSQIKEAVEKMFEVRGTSGSCTGCPPSVLPVSARTVSPPSRLFSALSGRASSPP